MTDIRIRQKTLIFLIIFICISFFYITLTNRCIQNDSSFSNLPKIFAITPTYSRPVQKAELTRLAQTLMLVPNIYWIIVEDANQTSKLVENILKKTELYERSTQLNVKTPSNFKLKGKDPNWSKARGVEQRNLALSWIRNYFKDKPHTHSFIYFMDDDNSYSIDLFKEISQIKPSKVGVWPVGLVGGLKVEKPILNEQNEVIGFNSAWRPERPFPIDMAGFAISSDLILQNSDAVFSYEAQRGYQESEILRYLTVIKDLQPMANFCKDVLVWHTRTENPKLDAENQLAKDGLRSDNGMEV